MKSMTGYGRATAAIDGQTLTVQVSSVNRKTLDLTIACPEEWESLESAIGESVRRHAVRGKVHVDLELTGETGAPGSEWDDGRVTEALAGLRRLCAVQGVEFRPSPELLWQVANAQRSGRVRPAAEAVQEVVASTLATALRAFVAMRAREGEALLVDFIARTEGLRRQTEAIAARAPAVPRQYREQLHRRLREAGLELDVEDERVLREIALFADRVDIAEELTRLRSHLDQFAALLRAEGEVGRKAEFLLQEIGREVNTIGSKANDLTISRAVIELKNELERIREQMANVE